MTSTTTTAVKEKTKKNCMCEKGKSDKKTQSITKRKMVNENMTIDNRQTNRFLLSTEQWDGWRLSFFFVKSFSSLRLRFAYFSAIFNTILFNVFQFDFETIFDNCLALCGQCTTKRMNRRYVQTTYPDAGIPMNSWNWMSDLDAFFVTGGHLFTCFGMVLIRTIIIELSLFKMNSFDEQIKEKEKSEFCCHTHLFTWSSAQIADIERSPWFATHWIQPKLWK